MVSRAYAWLATNGGAWSLASNWDDLTDGIDPSLTSPGAQDSVTIAGQAGNVATAITGQGTALAAAFLNNVTLQGGFTFGTLSLGAAGGGGLLTLASGTALTAGTAAVVSGSILANGAAVAVAGTLTLGTGQDGVTGALEATGAARVAVGALVLDGDSTSVYVDPTSSVEIGAVGGATAGALTIDAGSTLSGHGEANAYGALVNNGTIIAQGGALAIGATTGAGQLDIAAGVTLILNGATGPGQAVAFTGPQATLALATEFDEPRGTIEGFATSDAIDLLGSPISAATYAATSPAEGVLTLFYGNQIADILTLLGAYTNDVFLTAPDGAGGTLITVAPLSGGGGTASPGTPTPDQYLWTAQDSGAWNSAANWQDLTSGANPAAIAPGVNDIVTIAAAQAGSFTVIAGPANAASLAVTGDLAMAGTFAIGGLALGQAATATPGTLDLLPNTSMQASSVTIADGALSLTGGATLAVAGSITLGGGEAGIGLPVTALSATAGGVITCAGLTLGGGSGDTVATDPTGTIEIGTAGNAATGAVTIDANAALAGNGQVNPFGAIIDNGTIAATGGTLTLGTINGTGTLSIGAAATMVLDASTALPVTFTGAGATLALADERVALAGTITGFAPGDAIDIENDPVTGVSWARSGALTVVTLYYGATQIAQYDLAGAYTGQRFFLVPDGAGGTDLLTDQNNGGGGGGGQGSTDLLAWAQPGSGAWNRASNWVDVTTGTAATAPPGTLNQVQITGPAGGSFQTIGGPAVCATLGFFGNTLLTGAYTTGALVVGGTPAGGTTLTQAIVETAPSSGIAASSAVLTDGALLIAGASATLTVAGTLTLGGGAPTASGPSTLLSATGGARIQLGGLSLGGGAGDTLVTDATSSIEIGTLGAAQPGAVTIDAGIAIAGNGSINQPGLTIDNGTLIAQGGTLILGEVAGTGTLCVADAATLQLTAPESCPIALTGAGATLLLEGSAETPAAPIAGFVQGDLIVTGASQLSALAYAPGAGDVGTLTLYDGSQIAGTLLLAGDFSSDVFAVQPDGDGSAITLQAAPTGPSAGTTTPDDYLWTGGANGAWNTAANWADVSAGQVQAAIAPGVNDLVTVQAGGSAFTTITGPANAASLTLLGAVALDGQYATGFLAVGQGTATGLLALGAGTTLQTSQATITGGVVAQGGTLTDTGTLTLQSGVLTAAEDASLQTGFLDLAGSGDAISVDATSSLEIGQAGAASAGAITIDPGAVLAGAGMLAAQDGLIDQGTLTASGGTLGLGAVSGAGTLLVAPGATLLLQGAAAASLLVDFTGPGTLAVSGVIPQAAIAGFGDGCVIDLPIAGITAATYAGTAPNLGILTLDAGSQAVASLTLVGIGQGQGFSVGGAPGGTLITTETTNYGGGGSTMRGGQQQSGSGQSGIISDFPFWQSLPDYVQSVLSGFQENAGNISYVYSSPDGSSFGNYQPGFSNFAVVTNPPDSIAGNTIEMPPGYDALLIQGNVPLRIDDGAGNHDLLMGNAADDTIVGFGGNDTLVGGIGGNSVIWASANDTVFGGGNDTIVTNGAPCDVSTYAGGRSIVFTGAANNTVTLAGADTVVAASYSNDTVTATGSDTVFAPGTGQIHFYGGSDADVVVAFGGTVYMVGGTGNGSSLWCGNATLAEYFGGAGSASVIGGTGALSVQGGAGALTVFGGTGNTTITGAAGPSTYVVGIGATTVSAASGNLVWLVGAANDSLVASGGNVTVWGANSTGNNVLQAGAGPCTLAGGAGNDTFLGGTGTALMLGEGGANTYSFTNALAGGAVSIVDFNIASDQIDLHGYSGFTSALVNNSEVISLSDGTKITLDGITSMAGVTIHQS